MEVLTTSGSALNKSSGMLTVPDLLLQSTYDDVHSIQKLKRSRFDEIDSYEELQPLGHGGNGNCFLLK